MIPVAYVRVESPTVQQYFGKVVSRIFRPIQETQFRFELNIGAHCVDMKVVDDEDGMTVFASHDGRWVLVPDAPAPADLANVRVLTTIQAIQCGITQVLCVRDSARKKGLGMLVDTAKVVARVSLGCGVSGASPLRIVDRQVVSLEHLLGIQPNAVAS